MDPPQPQTLLDDLDYMLQAIRVFLQHLIMDPLQPQELVDEVDYMLEAIRVFLQHLIMDLPQPQELLDELDYMLQAMRVFLHQLWMHPLILLFIIYIILGHSYFMCRLDMRLRRTELTDYLDAYWLQLFGAPILFIIISDFIVGVEFDLMHTNDLIEISWGTVVRRAKRGLSMLCSCRKNDL